MKRVFSNIILLVCSLILILTMVSCGGGKNGDASGDAIDYSTSSGDASGDAYEVEDGADASGNAQ